MVANKFANAIANAANEEDYTQASAGGEFKPLPEGPCRLRFVGYIELGEQKKVYQGKESFVDKARFLFEVTGPKIEPREDGEPHLIRFDLPKSNSEKSGYFKLFRKMNVTGQCKVFGQLLGEGYRGMIRHDIVGEGADKKTFVTLKDVDGGWNILPPFYDDPESGERRQLAIPEPVSELRFFLWAWPDKEQWDSLFIDGEWEARDGKPARSKNVHQATIKGAKNWTGSPMQELLVGELDLGDVEKPERSEEAAQASADAKANAAAGANKAGADADPLADSDIPW